MNIAVVCGGISPERNVSLNGGKSVYIALKELGHNVKLIDPALGNDGLLEYDKIEIKNEPPTLEELLSYPKRNLINCINSSLFDDVELAFLVVHGTNGEDGLLQSLLELRGIKYTGSGVKASSLGMDKNSSKMIFAASGIAIAPWVNVRKDQLQDYDYHKYIRNELGRDLVIKPNDQGSSIGVTILKSCSIDELTAAILEASKYSDLVVVEKYIEGREITVPIIGGMALPVVEILPEGGVYDYKHKYSKGYTGYQCPADIPEDIFDFAQSVAVTAFWSIGCKGFARADFRLNEDGQPIIMEINTIPGFTSTSLVPMAAKQIGIDFTQLCNKIIELSI
jgi:D-alanine-D-alanine ligase